MTQLAAQVPMQEVDAEMSLLGSLFMSPNGFAIAVDEIAPEWFSDQFLRYLFEAARKLHVEGHKLSPQTVLSMMPEDCGGITRNRLYATVCGAAMPLNVLSGLVATVKDRWARRLLVETADQMKLAATRFDADPYEVAGDGVLALDSIGSSRAGGGSRSLDAALGKLDASLDAPDRLRGASTGLMALNAKLNGYKAGQLYVIAGRPGMGKSAFMCSSLRRTAQYGHGVAIFSLEMTGEEVAARMAADSLDSLRAPFFGTILKGGMDSVEAADYTIARESLAGLPLYVDDEASLTFSEIAGRARRLKAVLEAQGRRLSVICIDHMGLVTPSDRYRGNMVAEAGEVSGKARALAKELDCCVVLLCQLSRDVEKREDKRPVMSDLRWSGEIEQNAHVVAFLYREAYYLAQDPNAEPWKINDAKHKLEFLIRKNRNGETADISLWCSIGHSSVRDEL
jgi:replicative DNA helicase